MRNRLEGVLIRFARTSNLLPSCWYTGRPTESDGLPRGKTDNKVSVPLYLLCRSMKLQQTSQPLRIYVDFTSRYGAEREFLDRGLEQSKHFPEKAKAPRTNTTQQ